MLISDHGIVARFLNYVPGIIVLFVGVMAVHAVVSLLDTYAQIEILYEARFAGTVDRTASPARLLTLGELAQRKELLLYYSVIVLCVISIILMFLNADKLNRLKEINEEKKADLQLLEKRLAAIEAASDGIAIVDPQGRLVYMNKALLKLHGIQPDKVGDYLHTPWTNLYNEKGRQQISDMVLPALRKNITWQGESPIVRLDGEMIYAELSLTLLPDGGMIGTARDVTQRYVAEQEKHDLEQQFYQAQKMEAIGRLAGGIAHDFNNVLAAINGYAEFLVEDLDEGSPQRGFAENILQAGRQARDVVDQILAFSRQKQTTKDTLDMMKPIKETLAMLKASLPKTIELQTSFLADKTHIDGNATQISQVIMNLCVNAIDSIEDEKSGHGELLISLHDVKPEDMRTQHSIRAKLLPTNETPPISIEHRGEERTVLTMGVIARKRDYICLCVQDTGCGISHAVMGHILEPFFTTKAVEKGTGLGLATVHGVVSSHQGALVIDSTVGQGTRFEIYFPVAEEKTQDHAAALVGVTAVQAGSRVLIVEDQANVRNMLTEMLERAGYDTQSCDSGHDAFVILKDEPDYFDVIITDQNMPKMTGLELVQKVHASNPDLPFILVSGYSQERLQDMMKEHPSIKATLRKPVSRDELVSKINAVIADRKREAA